MSRQATFDFAAFEKPASPAAVPKNRKPRFTAPVDPTWIFAFIPPTDRDLRRYAPHLLGVTR